MPLEDLAAQGVRNEDFAVVPLSSTVQAPVTVSSAPLPATVSAADAAAQGSTVAVLSPLPQTSVSTPKVSPRILLLPTPDSKILKL